MEQATAEIHIPVASAHQLPAKTKLVTFFTASYIIVFQGVGQVFTVAATTIRGLLVAHLRPIWVHYYRRVIFGGEGVAMPRSALGFITNALIALAAIKFLFQVHSLAIMLSVTCLLMYGLASAAELVISCVGLDPTSVYAITAHLGKIISLCITVASLASLFSM